jgi:outer membrane protein W
MKRLLILLLFAIPMRAAEIEAGAAHVMMMAGDNDALTIDSGRGFSAYGEVFWSDAISARATATFLNPAAYASDTDLGTLGLDLYSATMRWHLRPRSRFSAFVGAGGAVAMIGNLDDQFGDAVAIEYDPEIAPVAEAGLRYRIHPRIVLELGVSYTPLEAEGDADAPGVPRTIAIDPMIVSAGAGWRF